MNDLTRYTVILNDIKMKEFKIIDRLLKEQLKKNLEMDGIASELIERYINSISDFEFLKTSNRSVLGQVKDSLLMLECYIHDIGTMQEDKLMFLTNQFNSIPMSALEKFGYKPFPKAAMKEELKKRY